MTSKLEQLRAMTTVVADTGDIEAVRRLKPVDCTTNPTIVLKALGTPMFADTVAEAIRWGQSQGGNREGVVSAVADRLAGLASEHGPTIHQLVDLAEQLWLDDLWVVPGLAVQRTSLAVRPNHRFVA